MSFCVFVEKHSTDGRSATSSRFFCWCDDEDGQWATIIFKKWVMDKRSTKYTSWQKGGRQEISEINLNVWKEQMQRNIW